METAAAAALPGTGLGAGKGGSGDVAKGATSGARAGGSPSARRSSSSSSCKATTSLRILLRTARSPSFSWCITHTLQARRGRARVTGTKKKRAVGWQSPRMRVRHDGLVDPDTRGRTAGRTGTAAEQRKLIVCTFRKGKRDACTDRETHSCVHTTQPCYILGVISYRGRVYIARALKSREKKNCGDRRWIMRTRVSVPCSPPTATVAVAARRR